MNCEYTAAAHFQLTPIPLALVFIVPDHVTGLMPPGRLVETGNANPDRKAFVASAAGIVVRHSPFTKLVTALTADGENVITETGTT